MVKTVWIFKRSAIAITQASTKSILSRWPVQGNPQTSPLMGLRFGIVPDFQPMRIVFLEQQTASVGYLLLDFAEHWGQVDLVSPAFQGDAHGLLQGGNGVEERNFGS